jgi:hypothetical protein
MMAGTMKWSKTVSLFMDGCTITPMQLQTDGSSAAKLKSFDLPFLDY